MPLRIEFGPKDMEKGQAVVTRRDTGEKKTIKLDHLPKEVQKLLDDIQTNLFIKAKTFLKGSIIDVANFDELMKSVKEKKMARAAFCCNPACEDELKAESGGVTARCIPFETENQTPKEKCFYCGKEARHIVLFARNY